MRLSYKELMKKGLLPECSDNEKRGRMCEFNCYYKHCIARKGEVVDDE